MAVKNHKFILFTIAESLWAMPLVSDSRVINCGVITPVLGLDKQILGMTYNEGKIITILDLAKLLKLVNYKNHFQHCLIFDFNNDSYGLPIDEISDTVKTKQIFTDRTKKYFNQYIKVNKQKIYIVNPMAIWELIDIYD